ncbi:helix-turn-helix transcriptional regulator [bacterium]|nr:helix-turn-helix transcriptional regulator [bacterium]
MTKDIKKILAKNIEKLRRAKRITQEDLSLELEFDGSYIGKIENAKMNITIDKIDKIAKYFDIEVYQLFQ